MIEYKRQIHKNGLIRQTQNPKPFKEIAEIPTSLLEHIIDFLKSPQIERIPIPILQLQYEKLLRFYSMTIQLGTYYPIYYRARLGEIDSISGLLNPPNEFVKSMGRCNDINESLLDCSNFYVTSILELKPNLG